MDDKPVVTIRPPSYQPKKVELEEDMSVNATPEEVRAALMRTVKVVAYDPQVPLDGLGPHCHPGIVRERGRGDGLVPLWRRVGRPIFLYQRDAAARQRMEE